MTNWSGMPMENEMEMETETEMEMETENEMEMETENFALNNDIENNEQHAAKLIIILSFNIRTTNNLSPSDIVLRT